MIREHTSALTELLDSDDGIQDLYRCGVLGDHYAGIDILVFSYVSGGRLEQWCCQCMRWKKMASADLRCIAAKVICSVDHYGVIASWLASGRHQDMVTWITST